MWEWSQKKPARHRWEGILDAASDTVEVTDIWKNKSLVIG